MCWLDIAEAEEQIHSEGEECWGILILGGVRFPSLTRGLGVPSLWHGPYRQPSAAEEAFFCSGGQPVGR